MPAGAEIQAGRIVSIWRYPVKSMMGEELNAAEVTPVGVLGDRAFALRDVESGKVVSAKNPRKWPNLFEFRSAYIAPPEGASTLPPVRITLPDGSTLTTDQAVDAIAEQLSRAVGRPVRLVSSSSIAGDGSSSSASSIEMYCPDEDFMPQPDSVQEVVLPPGTFFDGAIVHLLTTATLDALRTRVPEGRFEVRRFRPNLVIEAAPGSTGFVENDWIGKTLALGDEVRLQVTGPCPRCVMTTLAQGDLPKDPTILRAVARQNAGNVGVYATVVRGGRVHRGDSVTREDAESSVHASA